MLTLLATLALATAITQQEALQARRISLLWKDKDYQTAGDQMQAFIKTYPNSTFVDRFYLMRADLAWSQGHYAEAVDDYDAICDPELREQAFAPRVECLYQLKRYPALILTLRNRLKGAPSDEQQQRWTYFYAEALRQTDSDPNAAALFYGRLKEGPFAFQAQLALADLALASGQPEEAASRYLALADAEPARREALLLKTAQAQLLYNKKDAIATFSCLKENTQSLAPALGQAWLLYETGQHEELIAQEASLRKALPQSEHPSLHYFLGKAHLALKHFDQAQRLLEPLLVDPHLCFEEEKQLLLTLTACAQQTQQLARAQSFVDRLTDNYPDDPLLAKAKLLLVHAYKEGSELSKASDLLHELIDRYPGTQEQEAAYLELALVHIQQGDYEKAQELIHRQLDEYPQGPLHAETKKALALIVVQKIHSHPATEELPPALSGHTSLLRTLTESASAPARSHLSLGLSLEADGDTQGAITAYRKALATPRREAPSVHDGAQLRLARLLLSTHLYPNAHFSDCLGIQEAEELLKDLQTHKRFDQEPLHLEAAYDYAAASASLASPEQSAETRLRILRDAKKEFTRADDIASKDYQAQRLRHPEMEGLYQSYLQLFDARIAQLQAELAKERGDATQYKILRQAAQTLYSALLQGQIAVSKYVMDQAQLGLLELSVQSDHKP